jgi:hypothetical protein
LISTKVKIIILYLSSYFLLWYGYAAFIIPIFGYSGFTWLPNKFKVVEAILGVVFFALILPSKIKKPSDFYIHIHFLLPIVPMLVLYGAADFPREYLYFVLFSFAVVCFVRKVPIPEIKCHIIPMNIMMWSLLIIAIIFISSIIFLRGLNYINFNLLKVYKFRSLAAQNLPDIYRYLSPVIAKVLLPIALILAVYQRKWIAGCLAMIGSGMMFALTSHKGPMVYTIAVLCIYFLAKFKKYFAQLLLAGYIFGILVSLIGFFIGNYGIILGSLIMRRGYFVPALLNFYYYDFFSKHAHTFLAQSKLTFGLVDYPYYLNTSQIIGYHYYNNELTSANTGWLGLAYMNFGFFGLLLYALIIGLLFSVVDTLTKKGELAISSAILFIPFLTLFLSSDLPTTMLTHGLIIALFFIWSCQLKTHKRKRAY